MRELEEILKSVMNAEPGKLANIVQEALEETGGSARFFGFGILGAAIANIDERLQKLEDNELVKTRLARLEEATFGMTHDEAEAVVNSYVEAAGENPSIEASEQVKKAERMLGV